MDVVADGRAVRRVVVAAEHRQPVPAADSHLHEVRHEVVRGTPRVLAQVAARMGSHRVEVTQQEGVEPARSGLGGQEFLAGDLGGAVRVGGADGRVLGDRQLRRLAVDGARRREDEAGHAVAAHGLDHADRRADVVAVVALRVGDRPAHRLERSEVDHLVDAVVGNGPSDRVGVGRIGLDEREVGPGQGPEGVDGGHRRVGEVIQHDHVATGFVEYRRRVASDVARSAGDEDGHVRSLPESGRQPVGYRHLPSLSLR